MVKFSFTDLLKRKYAGDTVGKDNKSYRTAVGLLEASVSIIGNIVLFIVKLGIGYFIGSISVIADSFHTLSDVLSSFVILVGFKIAAKGPDKEHPYGHGRVEIIATLIIAVLLIVTGVEFIKSSVNRFLNPAPVRGGWWVTAVLALSALIKEWMARFSFSLGREIDSSALMADAWHHRGDAIAAGLVAVGNIAVTKGLLWIDPLLGLSVSLLIIYTGWGLARSSGNRLIGEAPPQEMLDEIYRCIRSKEEIKGIHDIEVHDYGYHKEVSLHVEVDEKLSLLHAHRIADGIEKELRNMLQAKAVVHVDPHPGDG